MKKSALIPAVAAMYLASAFAFAGTAQAGFGYSQNWINNWSVCEDTRPAPLQYTDDQIAYWDSAMQALGNVRVRSYAQQDVWASDLVEDRDFGGQDNSYSDNTDIYVYSGHGNFDNFNAWGETYTAPFCRTGTNRANTNDAPTSHYDSEKSRFGEQTGQYASPAPGALRYLILATCHSVNVRPDQQWGQSFWFGLDMVFGYWGTSVDSWYTDDALSSLAEEGWGTDASFKSAWFYAVDEAWVDDTGGIIASGTSAAHAAARRDGQNRNSPRRPPSEIHTYYAWSHYEG